MLKQDAWPCDVDDAAVVSKSNMSTQRDRCEQYMYMYKIQSAVEVDAEVTYTVDSLNVDTSDDQADWFNL